jgi:hypothetical protein
MLTAGYIPQQRRLVSVQLVHMSRDMPIVPSSRSSRETRVRFVSSLTCCCSAAVIAQHFAWATSDHQAARHCRGIAAWRTCHLRRFPLNSCGCSTGRAFGEQAGAPSDRAHDPHTVSPVSARLHHCAGLPFSPSLPSLLYRLHIVRSSIVLHSFSTFFL